MFFLFFFVLKAANGGARGLKKSNLGEILA